MPKTVDETVEMMYIVCKTYDTEKGYKEKFKQQVNSLLDELEKEIVILIDESESACCLTYLNEVRQKLAEMRRNEK